jgi:hypothetical protein
MCLKNLRAATACRYLSSKFSFWTSCLRPFEPGEAQRRRCRSRRVGSAKLCVHSDHAALSSAVPGPLAFYPDDDPRQIASKPHDSLSLLVIGHCVNLTRLGRSFVQFPLRAPQLHAPHLVWRSSIMLRSTGKRPLVGDPFGYAMHPDLVWSTQ